MKVVIKRGARQLNFIVVLVGSLFFTSCQRQDSQSRPKNSNSMNGYPDEKSEHSAQLSADATGSLDVVFTKMSDFDLINTIAAAIETRYGYANIVHWSSAIPLEHRVIGYVSSMTGGIENGGLSSFFASDCNHLAMLECLNILGLEDLSANLKRAFQIFPREIIGYPNELISYFGTKEKLDKLLSNTEDSFFAASDSIESACAKYLRKNKFTFEELLPEIRLQPGFQTFGSEGASPPPSEDDH
jgi:hypothetical protein